MNILKNKNKGFTIIELLVVISIISFLASIVLVNVNMYMAKARDAKRMSDMRQIMIALEMYRSQNGVYPNAINDGCGGWDTGNKDYIFLNTQLAGIMNNTPRDSVGTGSCSGYLYYRYPETDSVYYGCGGVPFYVISS